MNHKDSKTPRKRELLLIYSCLRDFVVCVSGFDSRVALYDYPSFLHGSFSVFHIESTFARTASSILMMSGQLRV